MTSHNAVSLLGALLLCLLAWGLSERRRLVNWRALGWGLAAMAAFALFVFRVSAGATAFRLANDLVVRTLGAASAGSEFLFGRLALPPDATNASGETSLGFILAFQAFPTIVFFSALGRPGPWGCEWRRTTNVTPACSRPSSRAPTPACG